MKKKKSWAGNELSEELWPLITKCMQCKYEDKLFPLAWLTFVSELIQTCLRRSCKKQQTHIRIVKSSSHFCRAPGMEIYGSTYKQMSLDDDEVKDNFQVFRHIGYMV